MKAKILLFISVLAFAVIAAPAADEKASPAKTIAMKLGQIDLDLYLEQYKEVRMEKFKTEMRLELLDTEPDLSGEAAKAERERLMRRAQKLTELADTLRARIRHLGDDLAIASK